MSIEAMKQALEALTFDGFTPQDVTHRELTAKAVEALRTAIQQAEAKTDEPVYWEWRHQGSHPDAVDFGQWSEWKRVEPRSALHTVEDALNEFRGYIARGHKYELRALYTHPAPGVPDWAACQRIAEAPEVDEALRLFAECETTEDQAAAIVQAVLTADQAQKGHQ